MTTIDLAEDDMYGGMTFNFRNQGPAAFTLLAFGVQGIYALHEMAERTPTSKNKSLCLSVLAAAGRTLNTCSSESRAPVRCSEQHRKTEVAEVARTELLVARCWGRLPIRAVLSPITNFPEDRRSRAALPPNRAARSGLDLGLFNLLNSSVAATPNKSRRPKHFFEQIEFLSPCRCIESSRVMT